MRLLYPAAALTLLAAVSPATAAHKAHTSPHAAECAASATKQGLTGAQRATFLASCQKGPLAANAPTAPTAPSKEAQAVTKPSGVDRTTRTKQCAAEADRRGLVDKARKDFQLSCLATAGPVTEGESGAQQPRPAHSINGIGVNNYKPDAAPAKSAPAKNPPAAAKPQR